jgi:TolA-binding protein
MKEKTVNRFLALALLAFTCGATMAEDPHAKAETTKAATSTHHETPSTRPEGTPGALPKKVSDDEVDVIEAHTRTNKFLNLNKSGAIEKFQIALESARSLKRGKELKRAESAFVQLLEGRAPDEIKRAALLDLAIVMQEQREPSKAQQLFSEYVRRYPGDASVPEVLLRQAYLYRDLGVPVLALSKFYAVISTCLSLQLDQVEYYQNLVLRAQAEIAETYFLDGKFTEAADYFSRLLRLDTSELNRAEALYKLLRCYGALQKDNEAVATARIFVEKYPDSPDGAEARFLLVTALKRLGRTDDAVREIGELLQAQHRSAKADPKQWLYWQQRAGNEIANQLYREGDFINALQLYELLAQLNRTPEWQIPVWYQIGLVLEQLKQPEKASAIYDRVLARHKEATEKAPNPSLKQISEMAAWRKKNLDWETSARAANRELQNGKQEAL